MNWFYIFDFTWCTIVLIVHVNTLILLYRRKNYSRNKNQIYSLIALCHTESMFAVKSILFGIVATTENSVVWVNNFIVWFARFLHSYVIILYYFFMILLTLDRFMIFYFNMRYPFYCTGRTMLKSIYTIALVSLIYSLVLVTSSNLKEKRYQNILELLTYVYIFLDIFYILLAAITYTYIFAKLRQQRKLKEITGSIIRNNNEQFKLIVPTLVIATYILFSILPNILFFCITLNLLKASPTLIRTAYIMYRFALLADPLIYVLNTKSLRFKCKAHATDNAKKVYELVTLKQSLPDI